MKCPYAIVAVIVLGTVATRVDAIDQSHYVRNAQLQIDHLTEEIHHVEPKLNHLDPARKAECQETMGKLWKKERLARLKLQQIKDASPSKWTPLRKDEDSLLIHLNKSYRHLVNRYF